MKGDKQCETAAAFTLWTYTDETNRNVEKIKTKNSNNQANIEGSNVSSNQLSSAMNQQKRKEQKSITLTTSQPCENPVKHNYLDLIAVQKLSLQEDRCLCGSTYRYWP